jgi:predicted  nucleic acid-binding Zn-ribbon protein
MRYEGAVVFPGMIMWAAQPQRGPAAPTGRYSIRITANDETKSRDFNIAIDPRLVADGVSEADLLDQFKLSLRVRDKVSEANQAVIDIRNLRQQINDRLQKVSARRKSEIQKLADAVMVPLTAVEEEAYQVRNRSGQDPLNYPIKLNNKIAALSGVIESADHRPTHQSVEVFNELSALLDVELRKMKETLSKQLPALKREKLDAVDPKAKPAPPAKQ